MRAPAADLLVELGPTGSIRGRVIDAATRAPVPEFSVEVGRGSQAPEDDFADSRAQEVSAADGAFVVEDLPVGAFTLAVSAGVSQEGMEDLAVTAEAGATSRGHPADGRIVRGRGDERGAPLEDAQVTAGASGSHGMKRDHGTKRRLRGERLAPAEVHGTWPESYNPPRTVEHAAGARGVSRRARSIAGTWARPTRASPRQT